ncbi:MAG: hypothetical protein AAF430_25720 [Myxococcota bacterium]
MNEDDQERRGHRLGLIAGLALVLAVPLGLVLLGVEWPYWLLGSFVAVALVGVSTLIDSD